MQIKSTHDNQYAFKTIVALCENHVKKKKQKITHVHRDAMQVSFFSSFPEVLVFSVCVQITEKVRLCLIHGFYFFLRFAQNSLLVKFLEILLTNIKECWPPNE